MRWTLKPKPEVTKVEHLKDQLQINDVIAALLVQRRPALRPCNVNKKFCINHLIVTLKLTDKE